MNLDAPITTIMTKSVQCVEPGEKLLVLKHMYEQPDFHSHVPVTKDGKLVGIVSLINFMRAIEGASLDDNETAYHTTLVEDIMALHPVTVSQTSSIRDAAKILSKGEFHSIVIADNGEVKGIVTTTDIIRKMLE